MPGAGSPYSTTDARPPGWVTSIRTYGERNARAIVPTTSPIRSSACSSRSASDETMAYGSLRWPRSSRSMARWSRDRTGATATAITAAATAPPARPGTTDESPATIAT